MKQGTDFSRARNRAALLAEHRRILADIRANPRPPLSGRLAEIVAESREKKARKNRSLLADVRRTVTKQLSEKEQVEAAGHEALLKSEKAGERERHQAQVFLDRVRHRPILRRTLRAHVAIGRIPQRTRAARSPRRSIRVVRAAVRVDSDDGPPDPPPGRHSDAASEVAS